MNKNKSNKKLSRYIILTVIVILLIMAFGIYKYNTYCLIYYVENEPPSGAMVWNTGLTLSVKVLNNGTLIYGDSSREEKLEKESLDEIRQLVSKLKEKVKGLEEDNTAADKFTINNKTYAVDSLDSEGEKIVSQIRDIVY